MEAKAIKKMKWQFVFHLRVLLCLKTSTIEASCRNLMASFAYQIQHNPIFAQPERVLSNKLVDSDIALIISMQAKTSLAIDVA